MFRKTTTAVAGAILALVTLASGVPARAATVPTGFQEYHVIGQEQHVWDMFNRPVLGQPFLGFTLSNAMLSVVSVTASSANQIIYYDHWEDNTDVTADGILDFEQDIVNVQTQAQTLVLGDGNPANGDACTYITGACAGDIIALGDTLTLNSNINTGTGAAPVCGVRVTSRGVSHSTHGWSPTFASTAAIAWSPAAVPCHWCTSRNPPPI